MVEDYLVQNDLIYIRKKFDRKILEHCIRINIRRGERAYAPGFSVFFSCLINRVIKSDKLYISLSCHSAVLLCAVDR